MRPPGPAAVVMDPGGFRVLFDLLIARGYDVIGPTVRDGAIVLDALESLDDLPVGWTDEQAPGHYRLLRRADDAWFAHVVGPHSWKRRVFPDRTLLFSARIEAGTVAVEEPSHDDRPVAALGVRSCDLHALGILDAVFTPEGAVDPLYVRRRRRDLILAVQCAVSASTCFCASTGTGPRSESGFDLAFTELLDGEGHRFLVESGTRMGADLLSAVPHRAATDADRTAAADASRSAAEQQSRRVPLDPGRLPEALERVLEHDRWTDVAERCLGCANCTMVCPTCFCSTVDETTDLTGSHVERWRRWDSCFTVEHSTLTGEPVHASIRSRYRQWLTHKFGTWVSQFGQSGCVGCGRCVTWCPVGIDVTVELAALLQDPAIPPSTEGAVR